MPIIEVLGMPLNIKQTDELEGLIREAVLGREEFGLSEDEDVSVFFFQDIRKALLTQNLHPSKHVIAQVTCLLHKPERTKEVRQRLADDIVRFIALSFKGTFSCLKLIEAIIYPVDYKDEVVISRAKIVDGIVQYL